MGQRNYARVDEGVRIRCSIIKDCNDGHIPEPGARSAGEEDRDGEPYIWTEDLRAERLWQWVLDSVQLVISLLQQGIRDGREQLLYGQVWDDEDALFLGGDGHFGRAQRGRPRLSLSNGERVVAV